MTQDTAHMPLDERGLEAAVRECARTSNPEISDAEFAGYRDNLSPLYTNTKRDLELIIRAYLQTAAADVSGQVEPVSMSMFSTKEDMLEHLLRQRNEAASTIQTISASNAALEAENERLRGDMRRIIDAPLIDHSNPHNNPASIARAALSAPKGGQDHG